MAGLIERTLGPIVATFISSIWLLKILLAIVFCFIVSHRIWKNRKIYALSIKLPGPFAWPVLGNAIDLGLLDDINEMSANMMKLSQKYGGFFRVWFGLDFGIVMSEPEDFECVLKSRITSGKGPPYIFVSKVTGEGIITTSGQLWRKHRLMLNPTYNSNNIDKAMVAHNEHAAKLIDKILDDFDCGKTFDIDIYSRRYTMGTTSEFIYGDRIDYQTGQYDDVVKVSIRGKECFYRRMCRPWLWNDFLYSFTADSKTTKTLQKTVIDHFLTKIERKRSQLVDGTRSDELDDESKKFRTPLDAMLEEHMKGHIERDSLFFECNVQLFAGVDTGATALSAFALMMAIHKDCQLKVWQDIVDAMGQDLYEPVNQYHTNRAKYLDMCILEVYRLFPTGCNLVRSVTEDFPMKHRNLVIPVGTSICLSTHLLNRNPIIWDKPDDFIPERFTPEESAKRHPFSYVPFSAGPRICIGQTLGHTLVKVAAIHMLRSMEFDTHLTMKDVKISSDISIKSAVGYPVKITSRKRLSLYKS